MPLPPNNPAKLTAPCLPCDGRGISCGERAFRCTAEDGEHDCEACAGQGTVEYWRRDAVILAAALGRGFRPAVTDDPL